MVDNFTKGLLQSLNVFKDMKDAYTRVLSFFHAPHNRDLYKATCARGELHFLLSTGKQGTFSSLA